MDSKLQPWKSRWPQNVPPGAENRNVEPKFGGGKGAVPVGVQTADETKVMRLDNIEKFLEALQQSKGKTE